VVVTHVVTPREKLQAPFSPPVLACCCTLLALSRADSSDALVRELEVVNASGAVGALQAPATSEAMAMIVRFFMGGLPLVFREGRQSTCPLLNSRPERTSSSE
jgi:hypothetical protein